MNEKRRTKRLNVYRECTILWNGAPFEASLDDVSTSGCSVKSDATPAVDDEIVIRLEVFGDIKARVTRSFEGGFGTRFEPSREAIDFALKAVAMDIIM